MNLPTQQSQFEPIVVEGDENEVIPSEDIAESEAALQHYLAGKNQGVSLEELEQELLGDHLE